MLPENSINPALMKNVHISVMNSIIGRKKMFDDPKVMNKYSKLFVIKVKSIKKWEIHI